MTAAASVHTAPLSHVAQRASPHPALAALAAEKKEKNEKNEKNILKKVF